MSVHQLAQLQVVKGFRNGAYDFEPEFLVDGNSCQIGADNNVKLHCLKAKLPGHFQAVLAKQLADSLPLVFGVDHEAGIGDVRPKSNLVGLYPVTPHDLSLLILIYVGVHIGAKPILLQCVSGSIWLECVRIPLRYHSLEDLPNTLVVICLIQLFLLLFIFLLSLFVFFAVDGFPDH